uniref:Sigma c capsid protein n=1 Tax=Avian orthoreovirus TaxID=38170 RepID=A0A8E4G0W3_9REOV|nr:sigma c capsid protein [Avian orthoreovirus]
MDGLTQQQRREVVGLILSLTSSATISPGDLTQIRERLSALESANASLNESVNTALSKLTDLSAALDNMAASVAETKVELNSLASDVQALRASLDSSSSELTSLSLVVRDHNSSISDLQKEGQALLSEMDNLKSSVSSQGLTISSLERRVQALEGGSSTTLSFAEPLKLEAGTVSLDLDPYFCSVSRNLTSYSADAQLMQFQWSVKGEGGAANSVDMDVNAHCHGPRTDYLMSTKQSLTVTTSPATLVFELDRITALPPDLSRLIPCHGFQQATFPVDISFQRDGVPHSYQVYGTYISSRVFKITFSPGSPGPAVIQFLTVRTGIDT